jgi:hypothetical protein
MLVCRAETESVSQMGLAERVRNRLITDWPINSS